MALSTAKDRQAELKTCNEIANVRSLSSVVASGVYHLESTIDGAKADFNVAVEILGDARKWLRNDLYGAVMHLKAPKDQERDEKEAAAVALQHFASILLAPGVEGAKLVYSKLKYVGPTSEQLQELAVDVSKCSRKATEASPPLKHAMIC